MFKDANDGVSRDSPETVLSFFRFGNPAVLAGQPNGKRAIGFDAVKLRKLRNL